MAFKSCFWLLWPWASWLLWLSQAVEDICLSRTCNRYYEDKVIFFLCRGEMFHYFLLQRVECIEIVTFFLFTLWKLLFSVASLDDPLGVRSCLSWKGEIPACVVPYDFVFLLGARSIKFITCSRRIYLLVQKIMTPSSRDAGEMEPAITSLCQVHGLNGVVL